MVYEKTGKKVHRDVNENFYLFAFTVLHLDRLDVDQLIHEYGSAKGSPAWVHISASKRQNKKQVLAVGSYTGSKYVSLDVVDALRLGTR